MHDITDHHVTFLGLATKSMSDPIQSVRRDRLCVCPKCNKNQPAGFLGQLPDVRKYVISESTGRREPADEHVGNPHPHALDLAKQLSDSMKNGLFDMLNASLAVLSHNRADASTILVPRGEQHSHL